MFSTSDDVSDWKATPTTSPASFTTGPPELPGLMAASIWIASSVSPPCVEEGGAKV
jgi:hypothetical protein